VRHSHIYILYIHIYIYTYIYIQPADVHNVSTHPLLITQVCVHVVTLACVARVCRHGRLIKTGLCEGPGQMDLGFVHGEPTDPQGEDYIR
jgi:hypothetical protein